MSGCCHMDPDDFCLSCAPVKARSFRDERNLLRREIEELREAAETAGLEYREDDGPRPYWRNRRALDAEHELRTLRKHGEVNNWDVLKAMSARNMDIGLAPLSNVEGVTYNQRKGGSLVRIGFPGNILGKIARGGYLGGLILADADQYEQVRKELEDRRGPEEG